jgi:hypothetical protein
VAGMAIEPYALDLYSRMAAAGSDRVGKTPAAPADEEKPTSRPGSLLDRLG